jgi:hypothetical protein
MPCINVRRGDYQQYDRLYKAFGYLVPVVWDRRRTPRPTDGAEGDSPREERRLAPPASWVALGFVVVDRPLA